MKTGRFLSNINDHRDPHAERYMTYTYDAWKDGPAARNREWKAHLDWIKQNLISRPKSTPSYTTEQLEAMGMIGIYAHPDQWDQWISDQLTPHPNTNTKFVIDLEDGTIIEPEVYLLRITTHFQDDKPVKETYSFFLKPANSGESQSIKIGVDSWEILDIN